MNFFSSSAVSFFLLFLSFSATFGSIIKSAKEICNSEECIAAAKNLKDSMDTKAKPCDDFYQYACGGWPRTHKNLKYPIPSSSILLRSDQNENEIIEYLQRNNRESEPKSIHKARQLYTICLRKNSYDGVNQMKEILSEIGLPYLSFWTKENLEFDYVSAIAKAANLAGVKMFFDLGVASNPHNASVNAIWLTKPSKYDNTMMPSLINDQETVNDAKFMDEVIKKMCEANYPLLCGVNSNNLIQNVLKLNSEQIRITKKIRTEVDSSPILTVYRLDEFQKLSDAIASEVQPSIPKLNWTRYVEKTFEGIENVTLDLRNTSQVQIVVREMDFIRDMIRFIHQRKIKELELGLWWTVVSTIFPYADYDIFGTKISIGRSVTRKYQCSKIVISTFEMALNYMYLEEDENRKTKIEVEEMLKFIKESYKKIFEQSSWMDPQTKQKLLKKLSAMKTFIAYPNLNELLPTLEALYGNVKITDNFLATMIAMVQGRIKENLNQLNEINDSTIVNNSTTVWPKPPTSVNAFYLYLGNSIAVPAALLRAPIYHPDNLKAFLYGSVGSAVGHEISHGFDYVGMKYNWWKKETLAKYGEKLECFLNSYDKYNTTFEGFSQKTNSTVTLFEDISDNVGFKSALHAYRSYTSQKGEEPALVNFDTFTHEQLLTLAFANYWCESPTFLSTHAAPLMSHSPNAIRVNGVFKHSQDFANIWNCPTGSAMNPSDEKCSLW